MSTPRPQYPMAAIVGQERAKLALIISLIDPNIRGVLIHGPKGTGKSLIVRALTDLLPEVEVVDGCPFNCSPTDPTNMCQNCKATYDSGESLPRKTVKMKIVQIPLGATEDRIIGSLDIDRAMDEGLKALEPGLLADANQNILYIDEVNLLPDHITDDILDAAASGWNIVERESVSIAHPSRFILIGSMNPEEGELRPQILDRFGIHASTENLKNPNERMEVLRRIEEYSRDPEAFRLKYMEEQERLKTRIAEARRLLPKVEISEEMIESIAQTCVKLKVDGHRPDIIAVRVAKALAAYNGRVEVTPEDVLLAVEMALGHRTRRSGLEPPAKPDEIKDALQETALGRELGRPLLKTLQLTFPLVLLRRINLTALLRNLLFIAAAYIFLYLTLFSAIKIIKALILGFQPEFTPLSLEGLVAAALAALIARLILKGKRREAIVVPLLDLSEIIIETDRKLEAKYIFEGEKPTRTIPTMVKPTHDFKSLIDSGTKIPVGASEALSPQIQPSINLKRGKAGFSGRGGRKFIAGRRAETSTSTRRGRYVWHMKPREKPWDIALAPTVRVAATRQKMRDRGGLALRIEPEDVRVKMKEYKIPYSIVLLVDMSYSMVNSMRNLARAVFSLHKSVYRRRDKVGLVVFKGSEATVLQHPTTNLDLIFHKLVNVGASDYTPLAAGLLKAWRLLRLERNRNRDALPILIVISDGIANVPLQNPVSMFSRRRFLLESQADVIDAARLIAKDGVRTFIINTAHSMEPPPPNLEKARLQGRSLWYTPTELMMEIARVTRGVYYGLKLTGEQAPAKGAEGAKIIEKYSF